MKIKINNQTVHSESSSNMTGVKDELTSLDDVICLSDNSNSGDAFDDSTDPKDSLDGNTDETDSSDSAILQIVVTHDKTRFTIENESSMSMKDLKNIFLDIQGLIRRKKIADNSKLINFHLIKKEKPMPKKKKKRHKNRKTYFAQSTEKINLADKREPKIEPKTEIVEETLNQPNSPVWIELPTSQPQIPISDHPQQSSNLNDKTISPDCSNETFLLETSNPNRLTIVTNNTNSFRRYEDLNNGDLDYLEETMDLNVPNAKELDPKMLLKDNESFSSLKTQTTNKSPEQIDNTPFEQGIKYEPELIIDDDDEVFRPTENFPTVPSIEKIKDKPMAVNSETKNSGIADEMTDAALTNSDPMLIKNEPIKEEPMSSYDEIITLRGDEEDHRKPLTETISKKVIETEKSGDNSKNVVNHCQNLPTDEEVTDCDENDSNYHATRRDQVLKKFSMSSERERTAHEHVEENSRNLLKKRSLEKVYLSSDCSNDAAKNSTAKKKIKSKKARIESDSEMEVTDEEATSGDPFGRPKSREKFKPHDEKVSHYEKKLHCSKRSHGETEPANDKTASVKKRRSYEKLTGKKKASHENKSREKSEVKKICKEEKSEVEMNCKMEKSEVGKISKVEKSKVCISDRLNKSEHTVTSHKSDVKRRHSSETKSPRVSEMNNDNMNQNSNCAKIAASPQLNPCGTPVVVLTKLNEQIEISPHSKSFNPVKEKSGIKNITKSSAKQEQQTSSTKSDFTVKSKSDGKIDLVTSKSSIKQERRNASTKSVNSLDNERKVLTPEPKYSTTKTETKRVLDNIESPIEQEAQTESTKSIDSLDNELKVFTLEPKYSIAKSETKHDINKLFTEQQPQTPSIKMSDCLDNNRKVTTPEPTCSASQSTKKLNRDWMLESETETEHDAENDQQRRKSTDSVSIDKLNTNRSGQYEGEAFNEASMRILFEQSQQKVEELKNFAMNSGVTIVKLQVTMEARSNLANEEPEKLAKQPVQFKQTFSVDKHSGKRDNVSQCSEEKKQTETSRKLTREIAVNEKKSPAGYEKVANVKTESRKSLDSECKESFTDKKVNPVNTNDSCGVYVERRKSLDVANEDVQKSGINVPTDEEISRKETDFPYDVERKPVTSFVGKIPKKTACQSNESLIPMTPDCPANTSVHTSVENSSTYEGKSPIDNINQRKSIMNAAVQMGEGTRQQNTPKVPPLLPKFPPKISRTPQQFTQKILQWNPFWFKKENNANVIQKLFGANYPGIRPTYESYQDYHRDAESLLSLIILDPLTRNSDKCHFPYSIVKVMIDSTKCANKHMGMTTLKLDVLISRRDSKEEKYPANDDLISINYLSTDRLTKSVDENEVFATIKTVRSEIISDRTRFNPSLLRFVPDPYELRTYEVMTKYIHDRRIDVKSVRTMTWIPQSHSYLKTFAALKNLLHSPLLKYILYPKVEDYQMPLVSMKYYSLVTKDNLDAQQLETVAKITETAIRRDPKICLIHGPPGTGKTKVVVNIVRQLVNHIGKLDKNSPFRILVLAPSNSAVDEIAKRLLRERRKIAKEKKSERFRMVRVGNYGSICPEVQEICLEELTNKEFDRFNDAAIKYDYEKMMESTEFHSKQHDEFRIQKENAKWNSARIHFTRKLEDNKARWNFLKNRPLRTDNRPDKEESRALYRAAESAVLEGAQVIVCTIAYTAKHCMESVFGGTDNGFSTCIIDESTKCSELGTLLPLQLGVKTLILVGDFVQQPHSASILPSETKLHGLDRSLFARLRQAFADHPENPIFQFRAQYRMAYPVAHWPRIYFYHGELHSCANLRCLPLDRYKVMNLGFTQEDREGVINEHEGVFVANLVMILMTRAGLDTLEKPVRIGVITPYHRQKSLISTEIEHHNDQLPIELKQKIIVDVHTIDEIQGQERDIIIMSCVTTNDTLFLSDKQKLCLAVTRAKNSLIICGNFRTYWNDEMWKHLLEEAQSRHFYVDVPRYTHEDDIVAHILR